MPERPSHPYGLDPAEELYVHPEQALPEGPETGVQTAAASPRSRVPAAAADAAPVAVSAQGSTAGQRPPTGPASRRARREAESARRRPQLPQVAAAALGVLAVLGGVVVAVDKLPQDEPDSTSMASTNAVSELPSVSMDATPFTGAPVPTETQAARTPLDLAKPAGISHLVDKEALARAARAEARVKAEADRKKAVREVAGPSGAGASGGVKVGVFRGSSPEEVRRFGDWLGRDVDYAMDFSSRTSWDEIADPSYMLETWKGSGHRMVYATAMLPTQDKSATMEAGARGEYDKHFKELARNLVAAGQGDAILRLGWEFNLSASRWHPESQAGFVGYWQRIVTAMRSVPGTEQLEFDWNPNIGGETYDSRKYYPGNDYVDYIGVDIYDISWAPGAYPFPADCNAACKLERRKVAWDDKLNGTFGLNTWADFARSKGKPLTFPEWGLWKRPDGHGGGDNPYFIEQMHKFIDNPHNNVAYQAYFEFDVGDNGNHRLSTHTAGGEAFQKLFQ